MSALTAIEKARTFTEGDISAGLTAQVASVVRMHGAEKVSLLSNHIFNNPAAGSVMHAYLADSLERGGSSKSIADELALVSDLQRMMMTVGTPGAPQ